MTRPVLTKGNKANQRSDLGPKKVRAHPRLQEKRRWPTKLLRQGCHQHYITRICHLPWVSCRCVSEHSCVQKKYHKVVSFKQHYLGGGVTTTITSTINVPCLCQMALLAGGRTCSSRTTFTFVEHQKAKVLGFS